MSRLVRGWVRVLLGLMPVGLLLVACSSATGVSNGAGVAAPRGVPTAAVNLDRYRAASSAGPVLPLTINVDMTDGGIQPPSLFIPLGQPVQLVMRNRGVNEHHFRVLGLVPRDLVRIAAEEAAVITEDEHDAHHHGAGLEAYRSTAGIEPTGREVHAYAAGGGAGMDVVIFTATKTGTFAVQCPLHPEITGKLTVF